jgi:hypothetical protein
VPETLKKQPSESFLYDMDFGPRLQTAETITAIVSIAQQLVDPDTGARTTTTDLTISAQAISGEKVQCRIAAGLTGKLYVITFKITSGLGNSVEAEGYLLIEDT